MNIRQIKQITNYFAKNAKIPVKTAYNQAGNRLAAKLTVTGNTLKKMQIPEGTASVDFLKVEKEFGQSSSNIISFKDISGNLIERVRIDKTPYDTRQIQSKYHLSNNKTDFSPDGYSIDFTDIKRTTTINGKLESHKRDMISYAQKKDAMPIVTHSRLETVEHPNLEARKEVQTIKTWTKGNKQNAKYLQTTGWRRNDGKTQLTEISGNTNLPLEDFKNDPYIMTRMYPNKDFIHSIKHHIADMNQLPVSTLKLKTKSNLKNLCGYYRPSTGEIVIGTNANKIDLVDTVAHEFRHKKQAVTMKKAVHNFFRGMFGKEKGNTNENLLGMQYLKDNFLHFFCLNGKIRKLYYQNGLEKDAFKTGHRFQKVYSRLTENLQNEFPHASSSQIGGYNNTGFLGLIKRAEAEGKIAKIDLFSTEIRPV